MSKSKDFAKGYADVLGISFENVQEISAFKMLHVPENVTLYFGKNPGRKIAENENADFKIATVAQSIHDGTLLFVLELMQNCLDKVGELSVDCHTVEIGNLVIVKEYDEDGTQFTPEDKPFARSRTTVILPFKCII